MSLATITLTDTSLTIKPNGKHRWLALKSHLTVPVSAISEVDREIPDYGWKSDILKVVRVGSHIPGMYKAGTYHKWIGEDQRREFWLVRHPDKAIRILLRNARYDAIIVEVDDPDAWVKRIEQAMGKETAA
jgi:hypothetical protein